MRYFLIILIVFVCYIVNINAQDETIENPIKTMMPLGVSYGGQYGLSIRAGIGIEFFEHIFLTFNISAFIDNFGVDGTIGFRYRFLLIETAFAWNKLGQDFKYTSINPYIGICIPNIIEIYELEMQIVPYIKSGLSFIFDEKTKSHFLNDTPVLSIQDLIINIEAGVILKINN